MYHNGGDNYADGYNEHRANDGYDVATCAADNDYYNDIDSGTYINYADADVDVLADDDVHGDNANSAQSDDSGD